MRKAEKKRILKINLSHVMTRISKNRTYRVGELFCGAGGMTLGVHQAEHKGYGFTHAWVSDWDADACKTLESNISSLAGSVICKDVKKLNLRDLPSIDGLCFGFPCNDFSVVGYRQGISGQYGGLYLWGVEALKVKKPLFFVAENVVGIKSSGNKRDFDIILSALKKSGYIIFPKTYHFEEYGVPQCRHRVIIVGFRKDLKVNSFNHPEPTHTKEFETAAKALRNIPKNASNNELTNQSSKVVARLKYIQPGENVFTAKMPSHLRLKLKSGAKLSQIYRRLKPNSPSYTVTGSGGGGTHLYHWEENRALTNRERARLQTFPDSFIFFGGKESVRKQIGMAVPPRGIEIIFESVLKTLIKHNIPASAP